MHPTASPRLNRIPRATPARPSQCGRLYSRLRLSLRRAYLRWLAHSLARQHERAQIQLLDLATAAHQAAQAHKRSAQLSARRQALRHQLRLLDARLAEVGSELIELRGRA